VETSQVDVDERCKYTDLSMISMIILNTAASNWNDTLPWESPNNDAVGSVGNCLARGDVKRIPYREQMSSLQFSS